MKICVYLVCVLLAAMPFFTAWFADIARRFQKPRRRMQYHAELSHDYRVRHGLVPVPVKSRRSR